MEMPALFGPESTLVGILTTPASGTASQGQRKDTCVLLFNAGVIHRIGPHRLNVKLARELADNGFTTLRFDLAGQGDSRAATTRLPFSEQAVSDLRAAMDYVEQTTGIRRFALFGICSGAVNAFHAALADERVVGVMMFDGFWYTTPWTVFHRRLKRFKAMTWPLIARRILEKLTGRGERKAANPDAGVFSEEGMGNPPRAVFARQLNQLVNRAVSVYFLYGGSVIENVSYENQLRDAFRGEPFVSRIECRMFDEVDHTVVSQAVQKQMRQLIRDWVSKVHAGREPAAGARPAQHAA